MKVITIANQSKAVMRGKVAEDFKKRQALLVDEEDKTSTLIQGSGSNYKKQRRLTANEEGKSGNSELRPVQRERKEKMREIQIFENAEFGKIRTIVIDNEPWFFGKDVATALGYKDTNQAIRKHVDVEDRTKGITRRNDGLSRESFTSEEDRTKGMEERNVTPSQDDFTNEEDRTKGMASRFATPSIKDSLGRGKPPIYINESGVYALVFGSKLPTARAFKHWVTHEVLPAIRKTGSYHASGSYMIDDPIERARAWIREQEERKQLAAANAAMQPKALFADAVSASETSILIGGLAKLIKQNGVDIGQKRLFDWLREHGFLIKNGTDKNMPTQRAMERELFEVKEGSFVDGNGVNRITRTTKVTGKGQIYFVNRFLKAAEVKL